MSLDEKSILTNYETKFTKEELAYREEIHFIESLVKNEDLKKAINFLTKLAIRLPNSPRCVYLSALIFDRLSEIEQSNSKLKKSIDIYKKLILLEDADAGLVYIAGKRLINRLSFMGLTKDAIKYNELLASRFPRDFNLINDLGVSYLMVNKPEQAKKHFRKVLQVFDAQNAYAMCHMAFIIKHYEKKVNESIEMFKKCLTSQNANVMDGRFFYHLGDALTRLNRTEEVIKSLSA